MNNYILNLVNMSKEELKKITLSLNLNADEQKVFDKIVKALDELYEIDSNESKEKISRAVATYMIYKQKGGK